VSTWWFGSLIAAITILVVVAAYLNRVRHIRKQFAMRLEERIGERARIARELHDSLLQGFQGLMLRLQSVCNLLPEHPTEARAELEAVLNRGDDTIAEGRRAVHDLRSTQLTGSDLVQTLTALGEELISSMTAGESPTFRIVVEGRPRALDGFVRDEVYRIAREALRNALRHSRPRALEVEVSFGNLRFSLRVRDDGVGIESAVLMQGRRAGHWGLPGMHERAQSLGGRVGLWSERGAGTEVELTIPAGIAYRATPNVVAPDSGLRDSMALYFSSKKGIGSQPPD
jgi:signal transduction histidine kinase